MALFQVTTDEPPLMVPGLLLKIGLCSLGISIPIQGPNPIKMKPDPVVFIEPTNRDGLNESKLYDFMPEMM